MRVLVYVCVPCTYQHQNPPFVTHYVRRVHVRAECTSEPEKLILNNDATMFLRNFDVLVCGSTLSNCINVVNALKLHC